MDEGLMWKMIQSAVHNKERSRRLRVRAVNPANSIQLHHRVFIVTAGERGNRELRLAPFAQVRKQVDLDTEPVEAAAGRH